MTRSITALATVCALLAGCSNYRLAAINDARRYALDKYPDLSEKSVHQIKFTKPQIRQDVIFSKENTDSKEDFAQTCIVWNLDDLDGKSLIIVGFGERQLRDWYPVRAIVRRYREIDSGGEAEDEESEKGKAFSKERESK